MSTTGDLLNFLKHHQLEHYTNILIEKGFTLDTLDQLTERDCFKLRITNKNEAAKLVGLGKLIVDAKEKEDIESPRSRSSARKRRAASPRTQWGSQPQPPTVAAASSEEAAEGADETQTGPKKGKKGQSFSATMSTANECCREATIYLQHHAVDRPWPASGSKLSRDLSLSTAVPAPPSEDHLYDVRLFRRVTSPFRRPEKDRERSEKWREAHKWAPTLRVTPQPPIDVYRQRPLTARARQASVERSSHHTHGHSAKWCGICSEHVSHGGAATAPGHWEYQIITKVRVGKDNVQRIEVWKPFTSRQMMKIDHAYMRHDPFVLVERTKVDFETMLWGKKPVRRRRGMMNFPTLKPNEVEAPVDVEKHEADIELLNAEFQATFLDMLVAEEQLKRRAMWDAEDDGLLAIKQGIRRKIDLMQARARNEFEAEEEDARLKIARSSNIDLNELWDLAGELAKEEREERERKAREEAEAEALRQSKLRRKASFHETQFDAPPRPVRTFAEILEDQRRMLEEIEAQRREIIEKTEAAEYANFVKVASRLNAQAAALLSSKRGFLTAATGVRCPKCLKHDCEFHKKPWANHWRHRGGALDLKQPQVGYGTLSSLLSHVNEVEYHEALTGVNLDRSTSPQH